MTPILEPDAHTHMLRLETPLLVLREHVPGDLIPLHAMLSDPATNWYLPDMRKENVDETEAYLRAVMRDDEASFRLRYNLMVVEKASGEAAGSVGLHVIDGGEGGAHYGLGYFIRRDLWNRGYATEAVTAALDFIFSKDAFRVTASCLSENLGSRRVLEKCGFRQEGLLVKHTWHDGQWKDCAVYGRLREDKFKSEFTKEPKPMFREMNRKKQQLTDAECVEILKNEKRGVLSVLGDDGYPYGTPINHYYNPDDGCLYFHSGRKGHRNDAMARCDKASFCVYDQGFVKPGDWALNIRSVIVFGRLRVVEDHQKALDISRRLSYKFTRDEDYISYEIEKSGPGVLVFELIPEHMTGKIVNEK